VVGCLFRRLDGPADVITLMLERMIRTPFPAIARPIHPSIAKFFDLRYFSPHTKYRFCTDEKISLRDYVIRYLRYDWNAPLLDAWGRATRTPHGADRAEIESAIQFLMDKMRMSNGSSGCERALSHLYGLIGDNDNAFAAYCHAMVLDADDAHAVGHYSHLLWLKGRVGEAIQVLKAAVVRWPQLPGHWGRLGGLLAREGRMQEAADVMQQAAALHPDDKATCKFNAELQEKLSLTREAVH
jgi:tetratricopeptide (TPR) repeat protein